MSDGMQSAPPEEVATDPVTPGRTPATVIWAFILSLLGICGITAIVGLALGLVGLRPAKRARSGYGLAIASIVISSAWLALLILGVVLSIIQGPTPPAGNNGAGSPSTASPSPGSGATSTPSPSATVADYLAITGGSEITTQQICSDYKAVIGKYDSTATKTLKSASKFDDDPYKADAYRDKVRWVSEDYVGKFDDALEKVAVKALNAISGGKADELLSTRTYLVDSLDACGLTTAKEEALGKAQEVNALAERINSAAERKPWYPKDYDLAQDGIAYKWVRGGGSDCYSCSYWTMDVIARDGCPSGLYVELNIKDRSGTIIDWTNDTVPSLRSGDKARLTFETYNDRAETAQISQFSCS